jgi:putative ABC transport system permease protein
MRRWRAEMTHYVGHGLTLTPLREDIVARVKPALLLASAAVGLVLLVVCANVSGLLLAHGEARRKELALRSSLGAGRGRLVAQLLAEALLLALVGGALGLLAVNLALAALLNAYPGSLPRAEDVRIDPMVFGAALLITVGAGILAGVLPGLRLTAGELLHALKTETRATGDRLDRRLGSSLVGAELALSVALVVMALLLVQSFVRLQQVPLGFDPADVVAFRVELPPPSDGDAARERRFFGDFLERLRGWRGVDAAGALSSLPLDGGAPPDDFVIEGRPVPPIGKAWNNADYVLATPGAFSALGMRLVRGRLLDDGDVRGREPVALINETLARRYWPRQDPIGQRVRYPERVGRDKVLEWGPWIAIVGVIGDVRSQSPALPPRPAIYVSHSQSPRSAYAGLSMSVVLHIRQPPAGLARPIRVLAGSLHGAASVSSVATMPGIVRTALARPRFISSFMTVFAVLALLLAALGVYGIVAHSVEQRRSEIGIRLALGADRRQVAWLVVRQALILTLAGILAGLAAAFVFGRLLAGLLFEIKPYDPLTLFSVPVLLVFVALLASYLPVRRAVRLDPVAALRAE